MTDDSGYTEVTDNSLVAFGDAMIPRGDDNVSVELFFGEIFEDGFSFGGETFNSLWISTNGYVNFVAPYYSGSHHIAPFDADLDSRNPPTEATGVFMDLNTERDSVVVTWSEIGRYNQNYTNPYTFQMELLDLGDGDAEIIFRYADMGDSGDSYYSTRVEAEPGSGIYSYSWDTGIPAFQLDEAIGNTGVAGVWQYRVVDGVLEPGKVEDGTEGPDLLEGTFRPDILNGLAGNDTLLGQDGGDSLDGGNDDDSIEGGNGNDSIVGGSGNDLILGGNGYDLISGQAGNDTIEGGRDADTIFGGEGDDMLTESWDDPYNWSPDQLEGGAGNDSIQGAYGDDTIAGQDGDDQLQGGSDRDEIFGGEGNDILTGGDGNDTMYGGEGDDFIFGDTGYNRASGNAGADTFLLSAYGELHIADYNPTEGDRLIVDGDLHDRSEFYLNPGVEGSILDSEGNRVISDVEILYRGPEDTDFRVIATMDLFAGVSAVELHLPSAENPNSIAPIVWDLG